MIIGDVLVIWRASAIWFDRKVVVLLPLFWWGLMIGTWTHQVSADNLTLTSGRLVNMFIQASLCQSGVSTTDYTKLCKVTNVSAPVLSIMTNLSVMVIILWKGW